MPLLRSCDIPFLDRARRGSPASERPDADLDDAPRIPRAGQNVLRPQCGVTVWISRGRAAPAQDLHDIDDIILPVDQL